MAHQADGDATPLLQAAIRLHPADPLAVARRDLQPGELLTVDGAIVEVRQPIPAGHKLALVAVPAGQAVRRYGQVIGLARCAIAAGEHVHSHNLAVEGLDEEPSIGSDAHPVDVLPESRRRSFLGYRRAGGRTGTRNYVAVLSTVNCSAHAARQIAAHFARQPESLAPYPHVDGVIALTHGLGCPVRQELLQRTLAGMARHPNVAGCLLVGLGCETNHVAALVERYGLDDLPRLVIQEQGGLRRTIDAGIDAVRALLPAANAACRTPWPISELVVALQCGGSDAWSGVTANPVAGLMVDELIRHGGTAVLAETPEIYGAEHLLTRRAANPEVGRALLAQVRWWEQHARRAGLDLDENRSVGNAAGGLSTIYEKSLGAVAKGGSTPLAGVLGYAEPASAPGLLFMNTPGYDPVSVTGQVAGGSTLVVFTTGRGSVFGGKPAPSIKISSHSALYRRMPDDIDLDAGRVLDGLPLEQVAAELLDLLIAVASGQPTKSEEQDVGEAEFCPWNVEGTL